MFTSQPPASARHRHPHGTAARGGVDRIFLARDWIHPGDDDVPSAPLEPGDAPADHPRVRPPAAGTPRPAFSVMIPTFEPDRRLCRALEAVLAQAPGGAESMQIAVVDDSSPGADVAALVRAVDPAGRVEVHRHSRRTGLAGNWNRAIDLARGRWIHLLHQDDLVLPGFYERIGAAFRAAPDAGMAFCRSRIVDGEDRRIRTTSRQRWTPGIVSGFLRRIAERQRVQTPAVVVARSAYERLGGFREDMCHALDWEMWVRIAAAMPVWFEPRVLAVYRRHRANESHRLFTSGAVWPDVVRAIEINTRHLPPPDRDRVSRRSARWHAGSALRTAEQQIARGDLDAAARTLSHLPRMLRFLPRGGDGTAVLRRAGRLQERLRNARRRAA